MRKKTKMVVMAALLPLLGWALYYELVRETVGYWSDTITVDSISDIPGVGQELSLLSSARDISYRVCKNVRQDAYVIKGVLDVGELVPDPIPESTGWCGEPADRLRASIEKSFRDADMGPPTFDDEGLSCEAFFSTSQGKLFLYFDGEDGTFIAEVFIHK